MGETVRRSVGHPFCFLLLPITSPASVRALVFRLVNLGGPRQSVFTINWGLRLTRLLHFRRFTVGELIIIDSEHDRQVITRRIASRSVLVPYPSVVDTAPGSRSCHVGDYRAMLGRLSLAWLSRTSASRSPSACNWRLPFLPFGFQRHVPFPA